MLADCFCQFLKDTHCVASSTPKETFYTFKVVLKRYFTFWGALSASPMKIILSSWQEKEPFTDGGVEAT